MSCYNFSGMKIKRLAIYICEWTGQSFCYPENYISLSSYNLIRWSSHFFTQRLSTLIDRSLSSLLLHAFSKFSQNSPKGPHEFLSRFTSWSDIYSYHELCKVNLAISVCVKVAKHILGKTVGVVGRKKLFMHFYELFGLENSTKRRVKSVLL